MNIIKILSKVLKNHCKYIERHCIDQNIVYMYDMQLEDYCLFNKTLH